MGCTVSKTDIQVGVTRPWVYCENGQQIDLTKEELKIKREVVSKMSLPELMALMKAEQDGKIKIVVIALLD